MRCCVANCKNDSRYMSKSQGITFHVFPSEPTLRTAWLKALGKERWQPRERSAVCSRHFFHHDLYKTRSGLQKVRLGAVPIAEQDFGSCVYDGEASSLKVCRICLVVECKMFPMRQYRKLEEAYEHLTGSTLCDGDKLPQTLCVECTHRLLSCSKLRNKSLKANSVMLEIISKHNNITMEYMKAIDRQTNELTSPLSIKNYGNDHSDMIIEYDETERQNEDSKEAVQMLEVNVDSVQLQNENEGVYIKNENDDYSQENDLDGVDNDRSDAEFVMSEKEMSSEDNLEMEKRKPKRKKREVRKKKKTVITEPKIDRRRKPFLNDDLNETLFTIADLTFDEQVAEIEKRRESSNYKNAVFKCTDCYKGFLDEEAYNTHVLRHTDQCGEFECGICKTHFKHSHALRKHITAHHTQRFSCNQCPYVTTHRQTARLHERWHKGTKYQCPHCQEEFLKFTTYMGHIRIKHPSDFVCQLCGYSFVSEKGIDLHKKLKHRLDNPQVPDDGPFCELCGVRFLSDEAYSKHLRVSARHNTEQDPDPKETNKPKKTRKPREPRDEKDNRDKKRDATDKRMYPSQMRKAEGPIPCEQCGMQLVDSRAYHGHFRRMHPDKNRTNYPSMKSPCMCEVCGRMFQSYALLKDHRWVHTGERPFACDACGKSFRMKQRLVAHRRVHSQHRDTYVCAMCGKHFSTHSNRQRHMFIHTGLKPFKCEMCGKCFKHASEKRAHITYVHLKKPWPKRSRGKRRPEPKQGQMQSQPSAPTSASEMDIVQPLWPPCDPKMGDISTIIDDKPIYYNLKI